MVNYLEKYLKYKAKYYQLKKQIGGKTVELEIEYRGVTIKIKVPSAFINNISEDLFKDPVITVDGYTYERRFIEDWFQRGNDTSPMTGLTLPSKNLSPNLILRKAIREIKEEAYEALTKPVAAIVPAHDEDPLFAVRTQPTGASAAEDPLFAVRPPYTGTSALFVVRPPYTDASAAGDHLNHQDARDVSIQIYEYIDKHFRTIKKRQRAQQPEEFRYIVSIPFPNSWSTERPVRVLMENKDFCESVGKFLEIKYLGYRVFVTMDVSNRKNIRVMITKL
jgi:hypothetical protein